MFISFKDNFCENYTLHFLLLHQVWRGNFIPLRGPRIRKGELYPFKRATEKKGGEEEIIKSFQFAAQILVSKVSLLK